MNTDDLPDLDDLLDTKLQTKKGEVPILDSDDPLEALLEEATRPRQIWATEAAVYLIHEQECRSCGFVSQMGMGWFARQTHATDPFANRLIAGKPVGKFPLRAERHRSHEVDICANCAEGQIAIESFVGAPYGGY